MQLCFDLVQFKFYFSLSLLEKITFLLRKGILIRKVSKTFPNIREVSLTVRKNVWTNAVKLLEDILDIHTFLIKMVSFKVLRPTDLLFLAKMTLNRTINCWWPSQLLLLLILYNYTKIIFILFISFKIIQDTVYYIHIFNKFYFL